MLAVPVFSSSVCCMVAMKPTTWHFYVMRNTQQWLPSASPWSHTGYHQLSGLRTTSLRVHLQVIQWKELDNSLHECDWGWQLSDGSLFPIMTDLDAAPANVLNYIRCKCRLTGKNPCGTGQCSCRKNGLKCVNACAGCRGETCNNVTIVLVDDSLDI